MADKASICKKCGCLCENCSDQSSLHLHVEIENLKQRLFERENHIVKMETNFLSEAEKFPNGEYAALTEEVIVWQEKYNRLYEGHKKLQKVNQSLEDKLLKIVDKFETEKTSLTRDMANLTQRLVEARVKINRLQDENERYRNDVNLAIQLLQCKPSNFVSQKLDLLPMDLQQKVKSYISCKKKDGNGIQNKPEIKTIKVPIPTFPPTAMVYSVNKTIGDKDSSSEQKQSKSIDIVSAAIMAKVLEEREKERSQQKHCDTCHCSQGENSLYVEKGTQTTSSCSEDKCSSCDLINSETRRKHGKLEETEVVTSTGETIKPLGKMCIARMSRNSGMSTQPSSKGTSTNILLDNAHSYSVVYGVNGRQPDVQAQGVTCNGSDGGRISHVAQRTTYSSSSSGSWRSTVLVHSPRSRSASLSSNDSQIGHRIDNAGSHDAAVSHWVQCSSISSAETEI